MRVEKLLKRLKREFVKVNLLQASLDALLFFLSVNLVLFLFSIEIIPGFSDTKALAILTFFFLIGDLYHRAKNYNLEIYEYENPELEEVLRTARDNLDQRNIVSQALFDDLLDRARKVTSESIIPNKKIIQKIIVVGILSFLTVFSGITGFQIQEDGVELLPSVERFEEYIGGGEDEFQFRNTTQIYGDAEDVDAADMDIDFNITGEGERLEDEGMASPEPEDMTLDVTGDSIDEDLELAKEYSLAIREMR